MKKLIQYAVISAIAVGVVTFIGFATETLVKGYRAGTGEEQRHYVGSTKSVTGKTYELVADSNSATWRMVRDGVTIATVEKVANGAPGDFRIVTSQVPNLAKGTHFSLIVSGAPGSNFYMCDCASISNQLEKSPDGLPVFWQVPKK